MTKKRRLREVWRRIRREMPPPTRVTKPDERRKLREKEASREMQGHEW